MNEANQAVGNSYSLSTSHHTAVLWNADGSIQDLSGDCHCESYAHLINNTGMVVGEGGDGTFLWTAATGAKPVVELIDPNDPLYPMVVSSGYFLIEGINDAGLMVGNLLRDSVFYSLVVLVPEPEA